MRCRDGSAHVALICGGEVRQWWEVSLEDIEFQILLITMLISNVIVRNKEFMSCIWPVLRPSSEDPSTLSVSLQEAEAPLWMRAP